MPMKCLLSTARGLSLCPGNVTVPQSRRKLRDSWMVRPQNVPLQKHFVKQMGNCITLCLTAGEAAIGCNALPIETTFKLPAPLPTWPAGAGFGSGVIDLGGLQVSRVSTFRKVWAAYEGGSDNVGVTFFEPSAIPPGFFLLGNYGQPNNKALHGWVLVGKDGAGTLAKPVDYTLLWSSESLKIKQDGVGYFWLPVPPDGYKAVGLIVTDSPVKPSTDRIRCVRSDFTDQCEVDTTIWAPADLAEFHVSSLRPQKRGLQALGVSVGTFLAQTNGGNGSSIPISCLKNNSHNYTTFMPNMSQIGALVRTYAPLYYFHPKDKYLPSSVSWYFSNGALLYKNGEESKPIPIEPTGSNLPQGGSNDGAYWLDLPEDEAGQERVKKGDLPSSQAYFHIKPMYGATFTDIAAWLFYPFNGPSTAKVGIIDVPLGRIGEHIGDWEHVTLRISNFNGELWRVYFAQHSGGTWVDASELEFQGASNRFVAYSSRNGHASYPKPGLVMQGTTEIGIRNDTAKSDLTMDTSTAFSIVAVDYPAGASVSSPPWLNYFRKWGPKISYDTAEEVKKAETLLPGNLKSAFASLMKSLPSEVFGEDGPTGPKVKSSWSGDEV